MSKFRGRPSRQKHSSLLGRGGPLVAVVGVSTDPQKYGHRIFTDLIDSGYSVVGINPRGGVVAGQTLWPSLQAVPDKPDLVMTVVPPPVTLQIVDQCQQLGITTIWMQPGSESDEAIAAAQQAGLEVIAHACFMKQENLW